MSQAAQVFIDHLNLSLPSEFQGRANAIAREAVRQLGTLNLDRSATIGSLNVPPIMLQGGESDQVIARRVAGAIRRQLLSPGAGVVSPRPLGGGASHAD